MSVSFHLDCMQNHGWYELAVIPQIVFCKTHISYPSFKWYDIWMDDVFQ